MLPRFIHSCILLLLFVAKLLAGEEIAKRDINNLHMSENVRCSRYKNGRRWESKLKVKPTEMFPIMFPSFACLVLPGQCNGVSSHFSGSKNPTWIILYMNRLQELSILGRGSTRNSIDSRNEAVTTL